MEVSNGLQVSYDKLKVWLRDAKPRDTLTYFVGELGRARERNPLVNKIADLLYFEEEDGSLFLYMKRINGNIHYIATRR